MIKKILYLSSIFRKNGDRPCEYRSVENNKIVDVSRMPEKEFVNEILADFEYILSHNIHLEGRVLTVVDGVISEEKQNKAVKDIIKTIFRVHNNEMKKDLHWKPNKKDI